MSNIPTNMAGPGPVVNVLPNPPVKQYKNDLLFRPEVVKQLGNDDFDLASKDKITLKIPGCILVLFYTDSTESYELANIWGLVAQQMVAPTFAAVNLMIGDRKIANAFMELRNDANHPLSWAGLKGIPFILVYRNGLPVAFYNGERSVQQISDYSLKLACKPGYFEPILLTSNEGIKVDTDLSMPTPPQAETAQPNNSSQYTSAKNPPRLATQPPPQAQPQTGAQAFANAQT
jgi:hypothetical protein